MTKEKSCNIDNCARKYFSNGYCNYHYKRIYLKKNKCSLCGGPTLGKTCMECKKKRKCKIDGCNNKHYGNNLCARHYKLSHKTCVVCSQPTTGEKCRACTQKRKCNVDECDEKHFCHGLCKKHYYKKNYADNKEKLLNESIQRQRFKRKKFLLGKYKRDSCMICNSIYFNC